MKTLLSEQVKVFINDFYVSYRPSTGQFLAQVQFVGKDKLEELVI